MNTVGIVGTAKNTGKTTTLSFLLRQGELRGMRLGVTGIGYDGEDIDTITSLPKPRLYIETNTIVATAEECVRTASLGCDVLHRTGTATALGEVLIARVTSPGLIVVAGPNRRTALQSVLNQLRLYGVDLLLVDGSLNRIAPMSAVGNVIFTTGASRTTELRYLVEEMKAIEAIFRLPRSAPLSAENDSPEEEISLLDGDDAREALRRWSGPPLHRIAAGMVSLAALEALGRGFTGSSGELVLSDPVKLLLAGEPIAAASLLARLRTAGISISFRDRPVLAAVTVNPFYPRLVNYVYTPAYVDKRELAGSMRSALATPVFNIKEGGSETLFDLCSS